MLVGVGVVFLRSFTWHNLQLSKRGSGIKCQYTCLLNNISNHPEFIVISFVAVNININEYKYNYVAYQNPRLIRPFPQCHLPKLKHISAEALPWHFTSLRLPWVSQWESVVALESDDPRCCIFPRSAKNNLASRSCPPPSWLCYLLVSSALCSP